MGEATAGLIPLAEVQERLPAGPDGSKPTLRWISTEARRLRCYRQIGRRAFIDARAWTNFVRGIPCTSSDPRDQSRSMLEALALAGDDNAKDELSKRAVRAAHACTWVYFIKAATRVKIGVARDPTRRMEDLQVGCPWPMRLIGVQCGDALLERQLHMKFQAHRLDGEWFRLSREIRQYIREVCLG